MVYLIKPSLKNYKKQMASNIKNITKAFNVCVKAATLNKRGLISLEEGIGAEAISLIKIPHNK
jgi:2C-methyl-D-erythritol 2,4-cyclodiphosphate synthase